MGQRRDGMTVGIVSDYTIGYNFSGMSAQLAQIRDGVSQLGTRASLYDMWGSRQLDYDLLHFFGLYHSLHQFAQHVSVAEGIKYVISPNSWPVGHEALRHFMTYLNLGRGVIASRQALQRDILLGASAIIANSPEEARHLSCMYRLPSDRIAVIPNGIDREFEYVQPDLFTDAFGIEKSFVLTVSQVFNQTKNHLNLLRAWGSDMPTLVFVGNRIKGHYSDECNAMADDLGNVVIAGPLPHHSELLKSAYSACSAFVLPSWVETTGLSALEAGLTGAPIAITDRGGTRSYFGDRATYCDPARPASIRRAVLEAIHMGRSESRAEYFRSLPDWSAVSRMVNDLYGKVLAG